MHEIPRQKLCELIATYGRALGNDPSRCEALLRDVSGAYRQEVSVLVSAVKEGVATELLTASEGTPTEVLLARLTQRLQDNWGLTADAARWAVESWALALGRLSPKELQGASESINGGSIKPPVSPTSPQPVSPVTLPDAPTPTSHPAPHPSQDLKRMSVPLLVILLLITGGIYGPVWFLQRRQALNSLRSAKRLRAAAPVFTIVMLCSSFMFGFVSGVVEGLGDVELALFFDFLSSLALLMSSITMILLAFRVRRILNEHFNIYLGKGITFSGILTFFFQALYIQYKINRIFI